jgi:hypothetical protein
MATFNKDLSPIDQARIILRNYDKVLVRDAEGLEWYANYFSYYREYDQGYPYACMGVYYRYCIPYEGNEHLLGTTDPYTEGGSK